MTITKLLHFQNDPELKQEIYEVAHSSYVDPTAVIEREYENNSSIYLMRDGQGKLISFFMNGLNNVNGTLINYLGLACVREEYKNSGVILRLFIKAIEDGL